MNEYIDAIHAEIKRRALLLVIDNQALVGHLHIIETAMLMGASVVMETPLDLEDSGPGFDTRPEGEELLRQLFEGPELTNDGSEDTLDPIEPPEDTRGYDQFVQH